VKHVYLAGDGARILGARAAETAGRLAAKALLQDFSRAPTQQSVAELRSAMGKLKRFAQGLNQAFPWPSEQAASLSDDTIVCRCEAISVGELRRATQEAGACESNRAKAFSRVGMGRCQGRYCGNAAAEIIAQTANIPLERVGRLRGQAPVKPLPIDIEESA
jgi:NADPH-dependent 2,4-dienoyl-CoA reductase/sulfur reductase-like enzyme